MRKSRYVVSGVPRARIPRSRFDLSHRVLTSGSVGYLYPFELQEVLPGDTFKVNTMVVSRLASSFVKPIMDNIFIDLYYFYVPARLCFKDWAKVFGETSSAWVPSSETTVPQLAVTANAAAQKLGQSQNGYNRQVGACFGLPLNVGLAEKNTSTGVDYNISVLPFRAFALIYNDFFRDENIIDETYVHTDGTHSSEYLNTNDWSPSNYTGRVPKVAKMHDYFTSVLPSPQRGSAVDLAINGGWLPVSSRTATHTLPLDKSFIRWDVGGVPASGPALGTPTTYVGTGSTIHGLSLLLPSGGSETLADLNSPINLWADGSALGGFTVNDFRLAFQYQKMLERSARTGSRYIEYLEGAFGVSAGDTRLQRPEFLGGKRIPISVTQVTQTYGFRPDEEESENTLGQVGAYSLSAGKSKFVKSFCEHGYIIGTFCIRQFHSYQQGLDKMWQRKSRVDFYDPIFANIGEQPVMKSELYGGAGQTGVFGYQEAWADYRQRPNRITGQMNSYATSPMELWHLGDKYASAPTLGKDWIEETSDCVDRDITVQSQGQDQFILDFWIENIAVRPMPTYSVPGLIDHH